MADFSLIKDEKLRGLVEKSLVLKSLDEAKLAKYVSVIAEAEGEDQEALIDYFEAQEFGEKLPDDSEGQLKVLNQLREEFAQIQETFKKEKFVAARQDQAEEDEKRSEEILGELEEM